MRTLESLPHSIGDAYQQIMSRIEAGRKVDKMMALRTLGWILRAGRHLKMGELRELISIRTGDRDLNADDLPKPTKILKVCQSLVDYDDSIDLVRFTHETVPNFLETEFTGLPSPFELAATCLTYLEFDVFEDGGDKDLLLQKYQALNYISHFWDFHTKKVETSESIQMAALGVLTSENRRNLMRQIKQGRFYVGGQTILHVLADSAMAETCTRLLDCRRKENDPYGLHKGIDDIFSASLSLWNTIQVDVGAKDEQGWTPMHWAAFSGHKDVIVSLLATENADPNATDKDGWSALHCSASRGFKDVVLTLLDKGADINARDLDGWTPLHYSSFRGFADVAIILLNRHADVNAKTDAGWTPLHCAAVRGLMNMVIILLDRGVDVDAKASDGCSALNYAIFQKFRDVAEKLMERTANTDERTKNEITTLPRKGLFYGVSEGERNGLNVRDALDYLDQIKSNYPEEPAAYNTFLDIMRLFKDRKYDLCWRN